MSGSTALTAFSSCRSPSCSSPGDGKCLKSRCIVGPALGARLGAIRLGRAYASPSAGGQPS
eukprot:8893939-Lingulodinium_polyedra.AAC.1